MPRLIYAVTDFDETSEMRGAFQVLKGLHDAGWDCEILTPASPRNAHIDRAWGRVPLRKVPAESRRRALLSMARQLAGRPRACVVFTWVWGLHNLGTLASNAWTRAPYAVMLDHFHMPQHWAFGQLRHKLAAEAKFGQLLRHANLILAETDACLEHTRRCFPDRNLLNAPTALWMRDVRRIERDWAADTATRQPLILATGQICARKRYLDLVEAFARVAPVFPSWRLEIRGPVVERNYHDALRGRIEALSLAGRASIEANVAGEALYHRFRMSSIYVLPSRSEGMPGSIVEAMFFGGAIAATRVGAVPFQLDGGCGRLIDPGDVDGLASALAELMSSAALRNDLCEKARRRAETLFVWERYFDAIETALRAMVAAET